MSYILALDQGTSSSRAILFDRDERIVAAAQREFPQLYPQAGWVEHDPWAILSSQMASAMEVLAKAGVKASDVAALGITNQRETTILWDRETGQPVYNAIVWQDTRTAAYCERLKQAGAEETIRAKTGLLVSPYFSGTKISWILDNVPGARQRAEAGKLAFGTVDSWLVWALTGGAKHITDRTNASRTLLFDIVAGEWDDELLKLFDIPPSLLPEIVWSSQQIGTVSDVTGLNGIKIAGIAGDQQAAMFGQLCLNPGEAKNTYGTGCFLLQSTGSELVLSRKRLITTLACSLDRKPHYALEGSVFIGGAVVQWLRDNLKFIESSADVQHLAVSVPDSGGVVFVPAFVGLGAPHWDSSATGLILGLRRETQKGHIARAAVESIAFQVADIIEAMAEDTGIALRELHVDGGGSVDDILLQFQADLLGMPVVRPLVTETTALGAAYLAGLAVGYWNGIDDLRRHHGEDARFMPRLNPEEAKQLRLEWGRAVERAKGWST